MTANANHFTYIPGTYAGRKPGLAQLADASIKEWVKKQQKMGSTKIESAKMPPAICISRKIGTGAKEIADILAEKLHYRVADRELLEYLAKELEISNDTTAYFDDRYPGKMSELASMLFSDKSFTMGTNIKNFVGAVYTLADMGSTIFVGRGTHLFLPRDRVLSVRVICSDHTRIKRLTKILDLEENEVNVILNQVDAEQRDFFKKAFGKEEASPYEFDIVINCDHITRPADVAEIIALAFKGKFQI
jgi:cytidylate kinase